MSNSTLEIINKARVITDDHGNVLKSNEALFDPYDKIDTLAPAFMQAYFSLRAAEATLATDPVLQDLFGYPSNNAGERFGNSFAFNAYKQAAVNDCFAVARGLLEQAIRHCRALQEWSDKDHVGYESLSEVIRCTEQVLKTIGDPMPQLDPHEFRRLAARRNAAWQQAQAATKLFTIVMDCMIGRAKWWPTKNRKPRIVGSGFRIASSR